MTVLDDIVAAKAKQVAKEKQSQPISALEEVVRVAAPPRGFARAIAARRSAGKPALIAEIKKASPSKGLIRNNFSPELHAQEYEAGGATCLSVLTDVHFMGENQHFMTARKHCTLPMLRKDFMVDPWQIVQSRAIGADCILLIVAVLGDETLLELQDTALELGMDVLVEVHDNVEMERALRLNDACMIGVNNRNLHNFQTSLEVGESLLSIIPQNRIAVGESGIHSLADITRLARSGASAFLVGESLMRADNVSAATRALLGH